MPRLRPGQLPKAALPLDPDRPAWDRQPTESAEAYAAFTKFRDMENRIVAPSSLSNPDQQRLKNWSSKYQWANRAYQWDRYVSEQEVEDLVRYRVTMNRQHRATARVAGSKFVQWLQSQTPEDVSRWKPMEAVRVWEAAVRIEREAAGMDTEQPLPVQAQPEEAGMPASLSELFGSNPETEQALALAVHEALTGR